jgi:hypothetical protein
MLTTRPPKPLVMTIQAMVLPLTVAGAGAEGTCQLSVILSCQEIIYVFYCDYK